VVLSVQAVDGGNLIRQLRELGYRGQIVVGNGLNTPTSTRSASAGATAS
jgi:branched-chain amino acid transport system substrate-binding protein